ncbi:MAG: hypothetical protein ACLR5H_05570 [Oscillospiraceae bacterium]
MADIQVINGNMAAAIGAALCRPDIIAAYPITPRLPSWSIWPTSSPAASWTAASARWRASCPP